MADVLNRTTKEYIISANTPDYPVEDWIINPDLSNVDGIPIKYWKILPNDIIIEMNQEEKDAIDAFILENTPEPEIPIVNIDNLPKKTSETGALITSTFKPELLSSAIVSHDFCDKTTWFNDSVRVVDEVLEKEFVVNINNKYLSAHNNWIDLSHGKVSNEDNIIGELYNVIIKVNGEVQTTGFTIDYENGIVDFNSEPSGTVTATYSYATSSTYLLKPTDGKKLIIEHVEIQFTKDVQINGFFDFEIWAYNPSDLPNKMIYNKYRYKNIKDIINTSNLGQGYIPNFDIISNDILVFPFDYTSMKSIDSASGMEVRIKIDNDVPCSGEWATTTFYCFISD